MLIFQERIVLLGAILFDHLFTLGKYDVQAVTECLPKPRSVDFLLFISEKLANNR